MEHAGEFARISTQLQQRADVDETIVGICAVTREGALNLYAHDVRDFSRGDVALATIFGQHASVALATARREESLLTATDARPLIGQAQGILMERFDLPADQAFAVLRRYSQDHNAKLRVVVERIIESRRLPT